MTATGYDNVNAAWAAADEATTALGVRVQALIDDINRTASEGLTGPQTENAVARMATWVTGLNAIGHNPSQPIPTPVPEPAPMPGPFADGSGTPGNTNDPNSPNFSGNRGNR